MFDPKAAGVENLSVDNWALVLQKMKGGGTIPSGFCLDCVKRRTERCPMRVAVWIGGYDTDYSIYDNTVDFGYCFKWESSIDAKEEETKPQ